jgi:hypothetical protein
MPRSASRPSPENSLVLALVRAIVRDDVAAVAKRLGGSPLLAQQSLAAGARRARATDFFFEEIGHYLYAGDTPLHAAAAGYRRTIAKELLKHGAKVAAVNRRGAAPLHYASDGGPVVRAWNPAAQAEMITLLIKAGAAPNVLDKSGVAPLHRAVRQRCPLAVDALLSNGAGIRLKNKSGSTPLHLACRIRGGVGQDRRKRRHCKKKLLSCCSKPGRTRKSGMDEARRLRSAPKGSGYGPCCRPPGCEWRSLWLVVRGCRPLKGTRNFLFALTPRTYVRG